MALGGGTFTSQNKVLPGTYINFVSARQTDSSLSDRGVVTMPLELDWGIDNAVFEVTAEEFKRNSLKLFGCDYNSDKLKGLRDLFRNAKKAYFYRLNSGEKASCDYAAAKYSGVGGNSLKVVISKNLEDNSKFDVKLLMGSVQLDKQTVAAASALKDNDWVTWKTSADLAETAGTAFTGGTNGTVNGTAYQGYLNKIEAYTYNIMGSVTTDSTAKGLLAAFCKRMRDEAGVKFQLVLYNQAADYEGVVNVKNTVADTGAAASSLVYWVSGALAACEVNKSVLNKLYDGEFTVSADYTQAQLETAIKSGEFVLHRCNNNIRVLSDINSLLTTTEDKSEVFKDNQTVRVIDKIGNDIAALFAGKYMGGVANNAAGRDSLWADIVKLHQELQDMGAIENFNNKDIVVAAGSGRKSVVISDVVTVAGTMEQLYMTVTVE